MIGTFIDLRGVIIFWGLHDNLSVASPNPT